jgi:hypothetical protein
MSDRKDRPARVPIALLKRAEDLVEPMGDQPELFNYLQPSMTGVIRIALDLGLATLERRCKRTAVEGQHARHVEHQAACDAVPAGDQ